MDNTKALNNITVEEFYEEKVPRLWDLEEPKINRKVYSHSERLAEDLLESSVSVNPDNHFRVSILKKNDPAVLGKSFNIGRKRFESLENKFARNENLARQYRDNIEEWNNLGHMKLTGRHEIPESHYYLPHIFDLLVRFRFPRYVMTADIEKMYRQIEVIEEDQFLQLVIWTQNPQEDLKVYKLTRVTFGITSLYCH